MKINRRKYENQKLDEKLLLILIIGCLESLNRKKMTIDESEAIVFSPYMWTLIENEGLSKKIIDLVEEGCYLEDYESILPAELDNEINTLKNKALALLKNYDSYDSDFWIIEE